MTGWLVYSTHPSPEQARETAALLLQQGLAACCNLLPGIESHYLWEGAAQQAQQEVAMVSKTSAAQAKACVAAIARLHPYDCPAVLSWPAGGGNPAFLAWLEATASGPEA